MLRGAPVLREPANLCNVGKYASLEHWYNNILIEENGVKLKNDYDGSSRMLTDVGQLQWVKLE